VNSWRFGIFPGFWARFSQGFIHVRIVLFASVAVALLLALVAILILILIFVRRGLVFAGGTSGLGGLLHPTHGDLGT